jgi:hypothetical protein
VGLLSRGPDVDVTVSPAVVKPRQVVTATVTTTSPVTKVTAASLEWGYTNFYRYHWAGNDPAPGGARDTEDWVCVTRVELPLATGEFDGTTATFKVPSWAPASSKDIALWSCRLVLERSGRDIDTHGEFTVLVGREQFADEEAVQDPVSVVSGNAETVIDIVVPTPIAVAGEVIRGHLILTPDRDLPDGDLGVCWQKHRESHPLQRTPAPGGVIDGPIISVDKRIQLRAGEVIRLPFEIPLPADAPPTATAVNSSMTWFIQARMFYAGFNSHMLEQVVKPIVVVNG